MNTPASAPSAAEASGMPSVSSSMRPGEPVAVAATTALSAALIAPRRSARRACFTLLKILAVARWEVGQPVDPPPRAGDATGADVLDQELRRVASIRRLLRGEVAVLGGRRLIEVVPVRPADAIAHAQTLTIGLVTCN